MDPKLIQDLRDQLAAAGLTVDDALAYHKTLPADTGKPLSATPGSVEPAATVQDPADNEKKQLLQKVQQYLGNMPQLKAVADSVSKQISQTQDADQLQALSQGIDQLIQTVDKLDDPEAQQAFAGVFLGHLASKRPARDQQPAQPTVSAAPAAAQGRPYRIKIGDQVKSYQVVNNTWKQVQFDKNNQLQVVADAPRYLYASLNSVKKKIDAQRAAGNLTDSTKPRGHKV